MSKVQRKPKTGLIAILAACVLGQAGVQLGGLHDKWLKDYAPKGLLEGTGMDYQQYIFALAGFREMIAGILWVRADSFFDSGQYDAVLPIIRLVTTLDPKQLDVFATGMWHIGYNFTDEDQRSDRRYIPSALALGKEGIKNNPDTYEMYFETAWLWHHKIQDNFPKAIEYLEQANSKDDIQPARKNLLATAYLRNLQLKDAVNLYYDLYDKATTAVTIDNNFSSKQNRETIMNNLDNTLVRMAQRGSFAQQEGGDAYAKGQYDTKPAFDVGFQVKTTITDPKIFRFEGKWNVLPVGTRILVCLKDADYDEKFAFGLDWDGQSQVSLDPPRKRTIMMDQLYVKNRRFNHKIDMSKDVTMYPFAAKDYVLEFYYNPRVAPGHIQDKFGYDGIGMTDSHYLNTTVRPGQRVIYAKFKLTRDQILRRGEWLDKVPTLMSEGFQDTTPGQAKDDVIIVPTLRSGQ